MITISRIKSTTFVVEVCDTLAPGAGRKFRDSEGRIWISRGVRSATAGILSNPPPPIPVWEMSLSSERGGDRLAVGEVLVQLWEAEDIRTARDWARRTYPQLTMVGVEGENEGLRFYVPNNSTATYPDTFRGIPVKVIRDGEIGWDAVQAEVSGVFARLASQWLPHVISKPGVTRSKTHGWLYIYRTFEPQGVREAIVMGLRLAPVEGGVRLTADICGEDSGKVFLEDPDEATIVRSDAVMRAAMARVARFDANYRTLIAAVMGPYE